MTETRRANDWLTAKVAADSKIRKSDRTRRAILEGALEFFWSRPFRELTVAELMTISGSSRSAFYQYFSDLHELMEALLAGIANDIFAEAKPWFEGEGDPLPLLKESLAGLVRVCYRQGPIVKAVADAAPMDGRLEKAWADFLGSFDDAVANRIEQHQAAGWIKPFEVRPVAIALNRMNAMLMIHHFGSRPRGNKKSVHRTVVRVWASTLYGENALTQSKSGNRKIATELKLHAVSRHK
jgi:AcrR family transcriptional regulator